MEITNEKMSRAEVVRAAVHGRSFGGQVLRARLWCGRDRVRVYVTTAGGKAMCFFGFPADRTTIVGSVLGAAHADVVAAVEAQLGVTVVSE